MFFLRRRRTVYLAFWIDAICINQNDRDEKSEQISRMRDIYKNASSVYAELGPASEDEQIVSGKMEYLSTFIWAEIQRIKSEEGGTRAKPESIRLPPEFVRPYNAQIWEGLGRIFSRPWWKRVWAMQEATAISSKSTYLLYGDTEVPLVHAFGCNAAVGIVERRRLWGATPEPSMRNLVVQRILNLLNTREQNVIPLLDVLEEVRGLSATDLRDIVYAALNIANDTKEGGIQPDYRLSVPDVYRAVAVYYLSDTVEPLRILSYCGTRFQHLEFEPGWASWVPSWQHRFPRNVLRNHITAEDGSKRPAYNASPLETVSARQYPITIDDACLIVHGFFIDSLSTLSRPCVTLSIRSGIQVVNSWIPKNLAAPYPTGETILDAFLKTVVADMSDSSQNAQRGGKACLEVDKCCFIAGDFEREGEYVFRYIQCRCLAYSVKGYMALASHQAREGDHLCALFGGSLLYVLRPKGDKFLLVGECYVHGLMDGEAIQFLKNGESVIKAISII